MPLSDTEKRWRKSGSDSCASTVPENSRTRRYGFDWNPSSTWKPTANSVWGDKASVLVGDFLFTRSFELMVEVGSLEILGVLSRASSTIAEGEVLQLTSQRDTSTPEATYLEVIKAKTAKLFAAAAEVGAMVAGRNGPERVALESFGLNLGILTAELARLPFQLLVGPF